MKESHSHSQGVYSTKCKHGRHCAWPMTKSRSNRPGKKLMHRRRSMRGRFCRSSMKSGTSKPKRIITQ
ncbi:hypothetical protein EUGRSUZ_A00865 [Eucalyptus grandis]|uniref:Uncharacterized protein n=2 Tax=Eucalyptus grandis TaxID=71139 RepID=A0ACC3M1B3_EUCGR|nr:hypothetical protein EUGRSUZ_A00865 [Eucalyptus grandis]